MSLCPYELNLTTQELGKGRKYTFSRFKEVKQIRYEDLSDIIENHRSFLEDGLFVILDRDVVEAHGLEEAYEGILTDKNFDQILSENYSDAAKLLENANNRQKKIVADIFTQKIVNDEKVNLNFVDQISRSVGYDIIDRANEAKKTLEDYKNPQSST